MEIITTIGKAIGTAIIGLGMLVGGWFGLQPAPPIQLGADSVLFFGGSTYYISGSGITSTGTSITLTSLTIPQTGQKILDADLSSTFFITVEPGNTTRQEFVSCTTVTQNSTGTATLSGCSRGLSPISPYTASTTLGFAHSGGSKIIFSNPPQIYDQAAFKANDETITGTWLIGTPTASTQITNKTYVDNVANAGAATSTSSNGGIVEIGTQAEMASGTTADANKPRVIITDFSTSTPDGTSQAGKFAVISEADGKLNQLWLDLTENFTLTGNTTFSGATTTISSATTTITSTTGVVGIATTTPTLKSNGVSIGADVYIAGGLGVGVATTTDNNLEVAGNILIRGTAQGFPSMKSANYATSTAFIIGADYAEVVTVGFRPKSIVGTVLLDGQTDSNIHCMFRSYEDSDSYFGEPVASGAGFIVQTGKICQSNQTNDDMIVSISAVSATGFTITWDWVAGGFATGTLINATVLGFE